MAHSPKIKDKLQELGTENTRLRAVLKSIEWVSSGTHFYCPWCYARKDRGHTTSCKLNLAIKGGNSESERAY